MMFIITQTKKSTTLKRKKGNENTIGKNGQEFGSVQSKGLQLWQQLSKLASRFIEKYEDDVCWICLHKDLSERFDVWNNGH